MITPPGFLPSEMGWRYWSWSPSRLTLCSPMYRTVWRDGELRALNWPVERGHSLILRNICGIHAALAPVEWWNADTNGTEIHAPGIRAPSYNCETEANIGELLPHIYDEIVITGLVERLEGKYLLGTKGWRAEWVIIRELLAPTNDIGMQLEKAFPDIIVRYMNPEVFPPPDPPFFY